MNDMYTKHFKSMIWASSLFTFSHSETRPDNWDVIGFYTNVGKYNKQEIVANLREHKFGEWIH